MDQLKEMGEFVRSASSTIEAPVVRRLKEAFSAKPADQGPQAGRPAQGSAPPAQRRDGARPGPASVTAEAGGLARAARDGADAGAAARAVPAAPQVATIVPNGAN